LKSGGEESMPSECNILLGETITAIRTHPMIEVFIQLERLKQSFTRVISKIKSLSAF
jgi:hypothetical protein